MYGREKWAIIKEGQAGKRFFFLGTLQENNINHNNSSNQREIKKKKRKMNKLMANNW